MTARQLYRNLRDTPFSKDRLIIWTLGISVVLSLIFIFALAWTNKDIPPSLTMAAGYVISSFTVRVKEDK